MSVRTNAFDPAIGDFIRSHALTREPAVLARLREETQSLEAARMQISVEQGRLMGLLVRLLGVRRAIEVGVFTGYSALCVALELPEDGRLVACDVSEEWTAMGRRYWKEAGVDGRIDLRIAPASQTLAAMVEAGERDFDFAFIDADKEGYPVYYERCLTLLRPGGVIAIDNVFWSGSVADPERTDTIPVLLRELTTKIMADERVDPCHLPIGDGVLLIRKR